jgi:hypothetical protein
MDNALSLDAKLARRKSFAAVPAGVSQLNCFAKDVLFITFNSGNLEPSKFAIKLVI